MMISDLGIPCALRLGRAFASRILTILPSVRSASIRIHRDSITLAGGAEIRLDRAVVPIAIGINPIFQFLLLTADFIQKKPRLIA